MADDDWISVAEAARIVRIADACAFINWGWKRKLILLRGVPIGGGELVDIPGNEGDKIDCRKSRVVTGRLFATYQHVIVRRAELERLAQVRAPPSQPLNLSAAITSVSEAHPASSPAGEAEREKSETLAEALASELSRLYPTGRPAKRRAELMASVRQTAGNNLGVFELTTLDRAMRQLGWTTRRPKRAKPPQPPR
jgi:hypothetical protein